MGSAYATAPVIFSNHPLATEIPNLVYNPFGLDGQLTGAGGRWTDGIWMLHGKTPRDIVAVLADIGNVVWSNNDYKYPIVSAKAVHEEWSGEFTTTLCEDLDFTNDRTKAWIPGDYDFVDSVPETGWDCVVYLSGPEIKRDSWQKRCMLEYILEQLEDFETVGGFVEQEGKVGIAVKDSNGWTDDTKEILEDLCMLVSNFRVYDSTNLDDWNSINWTESSEFEIEVVVRNT